MVVDYLFRDAAMPRTAVKLDRYSDESAFHNTIRENPLDPTPRLIYADLLDEDGHHGDAQDHRWVAGRLQKWQSHHESAPLDRFLTHVSEEDGDYIHDEPHWVERHAGRNPFPNMAVRAAVTSFNHRHNHEEIPETEATSTYEADRGRSKLHTFLDGTALV
jgi:uncharacterized protein (TIGR02996 family)